MSSTQYVLVHMRTTVQHEGRTYSIGREYEINKETAAQWTNRSVAYVVPDAPVRFEVERATIPVLETVERADALPGELEQLHDTPEQLPDKPAKRLRKRRSQRGREVGGAMSRSQAC